MRSKDPLQIVSELIMRSLTEVEPLMQRAFDEVGGRPAPGSSLDQVFLIDGREVVEEYLAHGEQGIAFDHLLYMVKEPPLRISRATFERLQQAADLMRLDRSVMDGIETVG